jgi:hypothetical protein
MINQHALLPNRKQTLATMKILGYLTASAILLPNIRTTRKTTLAMIRVTSWIRKSPLKASSQIKV